MDTLRQMKQKEINDYISSINLNEINTNQIAEHLHIKLGEKPAVRLNYKKMFLLNESGKKTKKEIEKIESITIVYTTQKEIGGNTVYLPVEETFIVD